MLKTVRQKLLKSLLIVSVSLVISSCDKTGDVKIFNIEAHNEEKRPGLIRRDNAGKVIEHITVEEAHKEYGCMRWDDIDDIINGYNAYLDSILP